MPPQQKKLAFVDIYCRIDPQKSVDFENFLFILVHTFKLFTFLGPTNFLKKYFAQINKRGLANKNIKLGNPPKFNKHRPMLIRNFSVRCIDSLSENTFFEKF